MRALIEELHGITGPSGVPGESAANACACGASLPRGAERRAISRTSPRSRHRGSAR